MVSDTGQVYVADRSNGRIQRFDANGNYETQWGSTGTVDGQFGSPYDISPRWVVGNFSGLSWSADGQTLAFSANLDKDGYFRVYTVGADGGSPRVLKGTASAWPQAVDWSQR